MRLISSRDRGVEAFADQFLELKKTYDQAGFPYWVLVDGRVAVGLIVAAREPHELIQPVGTPFVQFFIFRHGEEAINRLLAEAKEIAEGHKAAFICTAIESKEKQSAEILEAAGMELFDESFNMDCPLESPSPPKTDLIFERARPEQASLVLRYLVRIMEDSPDRLMQASVRNIRHLQPQFLAGLLDQMNVMLVRRGTDIVGALSFMGPTIMLVGVLPEERGKGYGRIITQMAMWQVVQTGSREAKLRVSVENHPAIHIYETLGFRITRRVKFYLEKRPPFWRESAVS